MVRPRLAEELGSLSLATDLSTANPVGIRSQSDVTEGPFPMSPYRSKIAVEDADGGSRVVWNADFTPDDPASAQELVETFATIYQAGLDVVRDRCES